MRMTTSKDWDVLYQDVLHEVGLKTSTKELVALQGKTTRGVHQEDDVRQPRCWVRCLYCRYNTERRLSVKE